MSTDVAGLLDSVDAVLLDFDGPVCSIFAGYSARDVAAELVELLHRSGVDVPSHLSGERDPLQVLRWTGTATDQRITRLVEDALCEAERRAVETAAPAPYGREVIVAARQAGLPVAVVSNNSAGAVSAYLAAHRLAGHVSPVIGRAYAEPERMKPNPEPISRAARTLEVPPARSVLVGDSLSDIEGAKRAGVRVIAYANRPAKLEIFRAAKADVVITSMGPIAEALVARYERGRRNHSATVSAGGET
ncbi:HAD family hydrolase [Pseudosporangium ferrugineum]|uniref:HAD superfamily hydrolase (TIGR01509 family)/HAD superfamily hydrolase (TIGR01549 family) n=1 Tax=Pseudosporangium ferrugineum TaxID=439699 RepID=A0A2T0RDA6_9ACTN|nr:HAD family hydrolase [Pseudosporangium ferrugineum]PRY19129.1 HAD superfamily hydrolase (TIGR01509 family)/HAD superfamily hydrolase (TIGR01549 family) [Pseudosporangium ferrugineum]